MAPHEILRAQWVKDDAKVGGFAKLCGVRH